MNLFKPKKYKHNPSPETIKRQNEWRRNKYHTDEEYRLNRIEQAKEYHQQKYEELGIEKKPKGRPRKYETKEEANPFLSLLSTCQLMCTHRPSK